MTIRILMVIDSLKGGGKERQLHELLKYMKRHGDVEIDIISRRRNPEDKELASLGYRIYYPRKPSKLRFVFELDKTIREVRPDIIHSWEAFVTSSSLLLGRPRKIKIINFDIQYAHEVRVLSCLYIHEKLNQLLAARNVANSEAGLGIFHLQKSWKNRVIQNGFDRNRMAGAGPFLLRGRIVPPDAFLVAMTASFTRPKDFRTLLEAGKRIVRGGREVFFVLIGDGPERVSMQRLIPGDLSERFLFLGQRTDVERIVREADIGVLLSKKGHAEGISNAIMEYMAAGKPVIATRTGGNPELVLDGITGYLIPHQDEDRLIQRIESLLDDPEEREQMGRRGRERIEREFSLEKMGRRFIDLYRGTLRDENRPGH